MASYPSFNQLRTSNRDWVDNLVVDRAESNAIRGRSFGTGKKAVFDIEHILSAADLATLLAFYDTNRTLVISFTWQGTNTVYSTCWFLEVPKEQTIPELPGYYRVRVKLGEQ